ncbi:MAG: nucleotide pyrophosphohydrolase [Gemmataceae bacterium]
MPDSSTTFGELKEAVRQFAAEREWQPFHTPKNLSMGLAVEAAELMEHFLWIDGAASQRLADDPKQKEEVADELADVACYLLTLSYTLDIDLSEAIRAKIVKNARKYPADKVRGHYKVRDEETKP